MSSVEEFKIIRLYRAYNTILQLCQDRGYAVRHPSAVAAAIPDAALYDSEEGLSYEWFLQHFVITPQQALAEAQRRAGADGDAEDAELLQRAAGGEWVAMRNAMRLTCAVAAPASPASSSPAAAAAAVAAADDGAEEEEADGDDKGRASRRSGKDGKKKSGKKDHNALMVFFSGATNLTTREVQDCREKALQKKAAAMIIVANKVPPAVQRDVQELSGRLDPATGTERLRIQAFEEEALAFNVVRHETMPRHIPMSRAETEKFLADRKLNLSQLPRMLESDPIAQYLGLARGDVVRIVRPSKESGPYDMYRQVI